MVIDDLRGIFLFEGLSDEQLRELITVGDEVRFETGDVLFREGEAADFWWVLLAGRVELLRRTRWEESVAGVMDRPGIWAGGFRAWADQAGYMATGRGASSGVMLRVPAEALGEWARAWFPFGVHLIEGFFRTVRNMEAHLAMAFAISHPGVTSALLGPRTMEQLDDLLAGVDIALSDVVLDRIDEIVPPGTDIGILDQAYVPPSIQQTELRRRPLSERSAA